MRWTLPIRSSCALLVPLVIDGCCASILNAQALIPTQGEGTVSLTYQNYDVAGHYVREEYLPEAIRGHKYYQPSDSGHEAAIAARLAKQRAEGHDGGGPKKG